MKYDQPSTPYRMLPPELRPHYRSRSDLRLLARAFRKGWVRSVPEERMIEWSADLAEALSDKTSVRTNMAALDVFVAMKQLQCELIHEVMVAEYGPLDTRRRRKDAF